MPVGWIDFSSEHRDRVRAALDRLAEPGAVDELGVGTIRDSFSDRLFPGISSIQTRPKYFSLTALHLENYAQLPAAQRNKESLDAYLERKETECRIQLVKAHQSQNNSIGIIGGSFGINDKKRVKRRPSSVYWNGLCRFGMVKPSILSLTEFGRRLRATESEQIREALSTEGDASAAGLERASALAISTPNINEDYWDTLSMELLAEEADFLIEKVLTHQESSLLARILKSSEAMQEIIEMPDAKFEAFAGLPYINRLDGGLQLAISHALDFWKIIRGAHIRYNCLVQERHGTAEKREEFEQLWRNWQTEVSEVIHRWDREFVWNLVASQGRKVKRATREFVDAWVHECSKGATDLGKCNELVRHQEKSNKRGRARLSKPVESVNDWVGLSEMEYRLPQVKTLIRDVLNAKGEPE